ncbi:MAG: hypothetical protein JJU41_08285 [Bacteroidetes bacterium]|nr:hypothetical protein [Bacteroidota bacterium]
MNNIYIKSLLIFSTLLFSFIIVADAQTSNYYQSQNFRLGEAHYRVADASQVADTILIWGDVQLPGTYLVPRGINLAQMLAYARGPIRLRTSETDLDWSKVFVEFTVTSRNSEESVMYVLQVDGYVPPEFFINEEKNFDTIVVRVRRQPNFLDYVRAYSPIIATVLNTLLLYRTIRDL